MSKAEEMNESLPFYLNAAADTVRSLVNRELEPHGITWKQLFVLMNCIAQGGEIGIGDLPGALSVDPGATTRLVRRIEAKGWAVRIQDENDRRRFSVKISAEGRRIVRKVAPVRERVLSELMLGLSQREQATMRKLLMKLLNSLRKVN